MQTEMFDQGHNEPTASDILTKQRLDAIQIDELALDEEFTRTPGDIAYWNERFARANRQYLLASFELEKVRARLWLEIKEEHEDSKVTIEDLKAMVTLRDEYEDARIACIEAEALRESTKRFADAVMTKKDMLQSLGAKLRAEMDGDPALRQLVSAGRKKSGV